MRLSAVWNHLGIPAHAFVLVLSCYCLKDIFVRFDPYKLASVYVE